MNGAQASSKRRTAALTFILITILLDMVALGMIAPVLPKLVVNFLGGDTAHAAKIYGLFGTVWALMQFVFSPVLGMLSDRFGRRPIVLISNFGLGLDYVLMALSPTIGWLFLGRVISGITAASVPTAGAYIADITPPEKRAASFGMIGAAFGVGFIVGPALGGVLGAINPRLPFWVAAGLSLANAMYGFFVLPESLSLEHRRPFRWQRANPVGALKLLRSHPELLGLAGATFLNSLSHEVLPSTFVLYTSYRYGWNERTVGLALAAVGLCYGIVQGVLVGPVVKRFGERGALLAGLTFGIFGFALFGFATTATLFCVAIPLSTLWGLSGPAAQGLMTRRVGPSEQGQLQGATGSLRGIAGLIGPALFTMTFANFISPTKTVHFPGAAFVLAAGLLAASMLMAWRVTRSRATTTVISMDPAPKYSRSP
jgi:DHA1 family tetracycline resistance protein-like MFS transporter